MLTKEDLRDAMARSATGVVKTQAVPQNVACTAPEALLVQLNFILKSKESK